MVFGLSVSYRLRSTLQIWTGLPRPLQPVAARRAPTAMPEEGLEPRHADYDSGCPNRLSPVSTGDLGVRGPIWTGMWTGLPGRVQRPDLRRALRWVEVGRAPAIEPVKPGGHDALSALTKFQALAAKRARSCFGGCAGSMPAIAGSPPDRVGDRSIPVPLGGTDGRLRAIALAASEAGGRFWEPG